jgi:hypothetical protein
MNKRNLRETFGEDISKLVGSFDFDDEDAVGRLGDVLAEPMILDSVVLRSRCHSGADVVLVNPGVKICRYFRWEADGVPYLLD